MIGCLARLGDPLRADRPVPALTLGGVERGVGRRHQALTVTGVPGHGAHPRTHRHRDRGHVAGNGGPQPFGNREGVDARAVGQQHDELVAAVPGGEVARLGVADHRAGDLAEHGVTGLVADRVVHVLEVIDVEHDEREGRLPPVRARHLALERLLEQPAIGEPGEAVAGREVLDLGEQRRVP